MPIITLKCPSCDTEFEYDTDDGEVQVLHESKSYSFSENQNKSNNVLDAYLECPKGHVSRYNLKKQG